MPSLLDLCSQKYQRNQNKDKTTESVKIATAFDGD